MTHPPSRSAHQCRRHLPSRVLRRWITVLATAVIVWPSSALAGERYRVADWPPTTDELPAQRFRFTDRPLTLNAVVGAATPVGEAGAVAEYSVDRRFAIGAGAGANPHGPVFGVLASYRALVWERAAAHALVLGLALSEGSNTRPEFLSFVGEYGQIIHSMHTYWVQSDIGYELLDSGGFHLSIATGVAIPVAVNDVSCTLGSSGDSKVPCTGGTGKAYAPLWTMTLIMGFGFAP